MWFTSYTVGQSISCDSAPNLCGLSALHGFNGLMPENNPIDEPAPFCDGTGNPQNMTWFAFIANTKNAVIEITFTNCQGGAGALVQYGVYTDCFFDEYLPSACEGQAVSVKTPLEINLEDMIPGEDYYLFIDGDLGTFCDFSIVVISGANDDIPDPMALECISDNCPSDGQICSLNETLSFQPTDTTIIADHIWTISPGPPVGPAGITTKPDSSASFTFVNPGNYEICLVIDNGCIQTTPVCYNLNVFPDEDNDGTCDADDVCPYGPEPGTSCDDSNSITINDVITVNCECIGEDPNNLSSILK